MTPHNRPAGLSLKGYYLINATAMAAGVFAIFLLNLATPTDVIRERFTDLTQQSGLPFVLAVAKRLGILLGTIGLVSGIGATGMRLLLKPVSRYLHGVKAGETPTTDGLKAAKRRIINLPFMTIGLNVGMWFAMPLIFFISSYITAFIDLKTAVVFSLRALMVGLISSSIAFYRIEAYSRRNIIPFFFPEGRLAELDGAARLSISRRIRMFFRLGTVVPGTVLLVTLLTLQWEVVTKEISASEFGRGILIFTGVLSIIFFIASGTLNRLVSRSIVDPLNEMLSHVARVRQGDYTSRVRVVSNDEIGMLGDAGNRMIRGLAEREMIRAAFGQYVTPEIRDEILSGRIPLEGERREATVLFADLRDFTPYVESNPPEEVIAGMRAYFTAMHLAIRRHKGLVLQFVGDEIEAVFGVPVPLQDHADAALDAALDMRRALAELNAERAALGKPEFAHGVGIHSGDVLAGNTGSREQSAYALIGNTVNIASRIQTLTSELGCDILASDETVRRLKGAHPMRAHPPIWLKGYSKPVTVHEITL